MTGKMTTSRLAGRRLLVVGASSGIGRTLTERAHALGGRVVAAARSVSPFSAEEIAYRRCDIRCADECERLIEEAVTELGGLDSIVFAAGASPIAPLVTADAATWRNVLDTNVLGAAMIIRYALAALTESGGQGIFLTSTMVGRPCPGMVPYSASRAALEELLRGVRVEHPELRMSTVTVGPTRSGFERNWDVDAQATIEAWRAEGYLAASGRSLAPLEVADGLIDVMTSPLRIDHIDLLPPVRARQWTDR